MMGYSYLQPGKDSGLLEAMVQVSRAHNTWGYRLVYGWLKGKVPGASVFRVRRLWKLNGYARLGRKKRRKLQTGARLNPLPVSPNTIWCMDFVEDRLVTGRKFYALLVKDEATAFALDVAVEPSFKVA